MQRRGVVAPVCPEGGKQIRRLILGQFATAFGEDPDERVGPVRLAVPHRAYAFEAIAEAHRAMEANDAPGKLVVTV